MSRVEVTTRSEEETIALGERIGRGLRAGDFVALEGELGAGKTRLVQGIARGMGLRGARVNSPTFVLVNMYAGDAGGVSLVHMDAYRLGGADDLALLGWDRFADGSNVVVIEWADRIEVALPGSCVRVKLEHAGEESRRITIDFPPGRSLGDGAACRVCGAQIGLERGKSAFCSERCKMADLGKWFSGDYTISRPLTERDLDGESS
ncbi:MAG: tRNA (adenosine(37)-N6)-threonylcarbamoyltransferase complex ATPase subunit type 1 TsaE [Phycisphaerae bacterium]|nr:tRNA (adenosine(37)-N6)-threonylcarbamoyltransferase complex ATPase subunit type 1 TsaE [Phycisphaerae bacterium]